MSREQLPFPALRELAIGVMLLPGALASGGWSWPACSLSARAAGQLPFALSWWGFTFPIGAFVAESLRLSTMLGWSSTFAIGVAAWLLLCFFWLVDLVPHGAGRGQRGDFPAASVSSACGVLWGLLALAGLLGGANVAIRRGLAAPRVVETGSPQVCRGGRWRLPTVNGKRLFGWFIPAGERAPALVVMHGWGGNAEMMLPLAAPLHERAMPCCWSMRVATGRATTTASPRCRASPRISRRRWPGWPGSRKSMPHAWGHRPFGGAGAALLAASRRRDLRAVVSLAAFAHPAGMMRRWLASKRIPHWPFGAYILAYVQRVIGFRFDDIAPCHTIARVTLPGAAGAWPGGRYRAGG